MSERAGSTIIPQPDSDFNRTLGEKNYIAPWKLRIKDDARDPAVARDFMDCAVPPMRYAESTFLSTTDLARQHDTDIVDALISGTIFRQRILEDNRKLGDLVEHFRSELGEGNENLKSLLRSLEDEKKVSSALKAECEEVKGKCLSLNGDIEALTSEKEASERETSSLRTDLERKDILIEHKRVETERAMSSLQRQVDDLKAELAEERMLKEDLKTQLDSAIQLRRDTLAAFPDLFRELLEHPDVKDVLNDFNRASLAYGKHFASVKLLKTRPDLKGSLPDINPGARAALERADAVFKAKAFPILQAIVKDLDAPMPDIFLLFAPQAPAA